MKKSEHHHSNDYDQLGDKLAAHKQQARREKAGRRTARKQVLKTTATLAGTGVLSVLGGVDHQVGQVLDRTPHAAAELERTVHSAKESVLMHEGKPYHVQEQQGAAAERQLESQRSANAHHAEAPTQSGDQK